MVLNWRNLIRSRSTRPFPPKMATPKARPMTEIIALAIGEGSVNAFGFSVEKNVSFVVPLIPVNKLSEGEDMMLTCTASCYRVMGENGAEMLSALRIVQPKTLFR